MQNTAPLNIMQNQESKSIDDVMPVIGPINVVLEATEKGYEPTTAENVLRAIANGEHKRVITFGKN